MLTRRSLLRWSVGMAVGIPLRPNSFTLATPSDAGQVGEDKKPNSEMSIEAWMTEWMSMSKAPGGILRIARFREPIYYLTSPISWTPNSGQEKYSAVTVPTGFVTDLASIPPLFFSLLRPDGEYAYAAVVHDFLYWTQMRSRVEADEILKLAMEDFEIGSVTINAIYRAVRIGGQAAWDENATKKTQGEKRVLALFPKDPRTTWEVWKQRPGVFAP